MFFVFMDESGYEANWRSSIDNQPFYVLAAVCLPAERYVQKCKEAQKELAEEEGRPLGLGGEIKARDIYSGRGKWKDHPTERDKVRKFMMGAPLDIDGRVILTVIDKKRLLSKYAYPEDPSSLALDYTLERIQWFLETRDEHALCIYDHNPILAETLTNQTSGLRHKGSSVEYWSDIYMARGTKRIPIDRIMEFCVCSSHHSFGLQVADFFASFAYQYYKGSKKDAHTWKLIEPNLFQSKNNQFAGSGLKEFP